MPMSSIRQISVVIPAHNEQALIAQCIRSVERAAQEILTPVEIVVCLNRCSDDTRAIVETFANVVIVEESRANVACVRNTAVAASHGDVIVTLDADSRLSTRYLAQVEQKILHGKIAGAGWMFVDRVTLSSIILGAFLVFPAMLLMRFSGGMLWMKRSAFDAVGGFDEQYLTGEDLQLWRSLRHYCRQQGSRFAMIYRAYILTSGRKMDEFGGWFLLTHPHWFYHAIKGNNRQFADRYLYRTKRSNSKDSHQ